MAMAAAKGTRGDRMVRQIVTPEAVALNVRLADRGSRFMALLIDLVIIYVSMLLVAVFAFVVASSVVSFGWLIAFLFLASFLLRSPYFMYFELRWRGMTPGKRVMNIRVIDRDGGPLTADAVVARNLLREVEVFLPLTIVFAPIPALVSDWFSIICVIWTVVVLLIVLLHRDAMRIGDLIARTWVIENERRALESDLAQRDKRISQAERYRFTDAELDAYGIHELQVLEDILRKANRRDGAEVLADVSFRIRRKIGWDTTQPFTDHAGFLQAYYAGLRGRLEQGLLYGKRRESKHDTAVFDGKKRP